MALPEITAEQKYIIRETQLKIAQASIDITNIRAKADQDIRAAQQRQNQETLKLRTFIENIAKEGGVDFTKANFDLDALKFNELAPAPDAAPAQATESAAPAQA